MVFFASCLIVLSFQKKIDELTAALSRNKLAHHLSIMTISVFEVFSCVMIAEAIKLTNEHVTSNKQDSASLRFFMVSCFDGLCIIVFVLCMSAILGSRFNFTTEFCQVILSTIVSFKNRLWTKLYFQFIFHPKKWQFCLGVWF